jgi:hypothetical protein
MLEEMQMRFGGKTWKKTVEDLGMDDVKMDFQA